VNVIIFNMDSPIFLQESAFTPLELFQIISIS